MNGNEVNRPDFKWTGLEDAAYSLGSYAWRIIDNADRYTVMPRKTFTWWMWFILLCPLLGVAAISIVRGGSLFPELLLGGVIALILFFLQMWAAREFRKGGWIDIDRTQGKSRLPRLDLTFENNSFRAVRFYSWPTKTDPPVFKALFYLCKSDSEMFPVIFTDGTQETEAFGKRIAEILGIPFEKVEKS